MSSMGKRSDWLKLYENPRVPTDPAKIGFFTPPARDDTQRKFPDGGINKMQPELGDISLKTKLTWEEPAPDKRKVSDIIDEMQ